MSTSHALTIAVDDQFTIHSAAQSAAEKVRTLLLAILPDAPRTRPAADYFGRASHLVCQSAPVTSFRRVP
jgi:hypothetical protein